MGRRPPCRAPPTAKRAFFRSCFVPRSPLFTRFKKNSTFFFSFLPTLTLRHLSRLRAWVGEKFTGSPIAPIYTRSSFSCLLEINGRNNPSKKMKCSGIRFFVVVFDGDVSQNFTQNLKTHTAHTHTQYRDSSTRGRTPNQSPGIRNICSRPQRLAFLGGRTKMELWPQSKLIKGESA